MSFDLTLDVGATTFAALAVLIALLAELREYRRRRTAELTASVVAEQRLTSARHIGGRTEQGPQTITRYWLVIENTGEADATDVDLDATTPDGRRSLLHLEDDSPKFTVDEQGVDGPAAFLDVEPGELPLGRLGPGTSYGFRWLTPALSFAPTGERAQVTVRWCDADPPWWRFGRVSRRTTTLPVKLGP